MNNVNEAQMITDDFISILPKISAFINKKVNSKEDAEDILQQTYLNGINSINKGNFPDKLENWSMSIAKNAICSFYRKKTEKDVDNIEEICLYQSDKRNNSDPMITDNSNFNLENQEICRIVIDEIENMMSQEGDIMIKGKILYHKFVEQMKEKDIAIVLEMPLGSVKRHTHFARIYLRDSTGNLIEDF